MRIPPSRAALGVIAGIALLSCTDTSTAPRMQRTAGGGVNRLVSGTFPTLYISQVYGGGGNSGATFTNDFIELFNPGSSAVALNGMSVQYASATGTTWQVTSLTGSVQPGGYYLVQESQGAGGTTALPTPDATGTIAMAAGAGKVFLVSSQVAQSGACPSGTSVIDEVSYGAASDCTFKLAPALANATSDSRGDAGCKYSFDESVDFTAGAANPRNTAATPRTPCPVAVGPLDHIVIGGPNTVAAGSSIQLTATPQDANNVTVPNVTIAWSSDNTGIATVDQTGKVTGIVASATAVSITAALGTVTKSVTISVTAPSSPAAVVISEVYGGGGNSGSTLKNDFVELFNRTPNPVSLAGWSVQYISANGTAAWQVTPLQGTIAGNSYVLVQEAQGAGGTVDLPTPDDIGTIAMSATDARVALVNSTTALAASSPANCPTTAAGVVDLVAYGTTACGSPTTSFDAPTLSATLAAFRINDGCEATGNPQADFFAAAPNPRNSTIEARSCVLGPLDRITVAGGATVGTGSSIQLKAKGLDASGNQLTQTAFTWSTSDPARATVSPSGVVTGGTTLGAVTISAASGAVTGSTTITVVDPNAPATISLISKAAFTYPAGYVDVLLSTVTNGNGNTIFPTLTWTSSDPTVATVDAQGSVLGVAPGAVTITATAPNGVTGTQRLTIESHTAPTTAVYRDHLAFGTPTDNNPSDDLILTKAQYVLSYNTTRSGANWVSWNLNATHFGPAPRCNCFSPDPDLPAQFYHVTDFDYTSSGYDRGHMTMSEERTTTDQENATTYLLTNVLPQSDDNNAGPWENFEFFLNDQAQSNGKEVYIIAGGQWGPTVHTLKGEGHVGIPDFTWKVAVLLPAGQGLANVRTSQDLQVIAVRMPNLIAADAPTGLPGSSAVGLKGQPWQNFQTTARSIEQATGYNLLSALPDSIQNIVETNDHAPVAALSAPASVNEGSAAAFDASGSTDVDAGDAAGFKYVWNFGDGSPAVTTTTAQQSHVYADNGAYTVTLFVYDPAGASGKATSVVTVNNVAPAVMFGSLMSLTLESGDPIAASGSFTDPGPDSPWNASINWGDGTTNSPIPSSFSRSGSSMLGGSRYFVPGTYNATLSVTDKDGGVGTSSFVVTVNRRDIRADVNPAKIKLSDNGGDNVDVMLYSDLLAHMSDLDVASAKIGTVGVNVKNNGKFDADVELLGVRIRLRFSRQALIAAGVLGAGTTNMDLVANLTNGIQIIAHVPVTTTN